MGAAVALAVFLAGLQGFLGALVIALALGLLIRNTGLFHPRIRHGIRAATKRFLRLGVVLLGLQLSLPEILGLGLPVLLLIIASVFVSFFVTRYIGERLGLTRAASTLMAAGFSICGASAIAGMQSIVDADDDEVAGAIAMVTLYGSAAILGLPVADSWRLFWSAPRASSPDPSWTPPPSRPRCCSRRRCSGWVPASTSRILPAREAAAWSWEASRRSSSAGSPSPAP
jgi:uncharacterized integral membrane protein (TIGR00698 family)